MVRGRWGVRRLVRRGGQVARGAARRLADLRATRLRQSGPDQLRTGFRHHRPLTPGSEPFPVRRPTLRLRLSDPAALLRLASPGVLAGRVRHLTVRVVDVPDPLLAGLRPPRLRPGTATFRWRRRGRGVVVTLRWARAQELPAALADLTGAVLRVRAWEQLSGPDPAIGHPATAGDDATVPTNVANPYGRVLLGQATRYHLVPGRGLRDDAGRWVLRHHPGQRPEAALLAARVDKYAVVTVDRPPEPATAGLVRTLAACGMVFAAADPVVRAALVTLGAVTVAEPAQVTGLTGYALSVRAARQMALTADPTLRRTALAGPGAHRLPTVTALLSSMRADHLPACLNYLAAQTYPALEVVVGLHGYRVPEETVRRWQERSPHRLRVVGYPAELPFGQVLGELSRLADGELVTKLDDDDHYGPDHVTDLVVAWHTSGADLVAKGARFVHFPERDETIDRAWAAPEVFDVTPAGGTMLLGKGTLAQVGGWSHAPRHVDADLLARVRSAGGLVYRTHALEYVYVRRSRGHTFVTRTEELLTHAAHTYPGLPPELIRPGSAPKVNTAR